MPFEFFIPRGRSLGWTGGNAYPARLVLIGLLLPAACNPRMAAPPGELAFVTAERSNAVLVADLDTMKVVSSIPVSRAPVAVRACSIRDEVYVATRAGRLEVIDAGQRRVVASIAVAGSPVRLEMVEDGNTAFVLSRVEPFVHVVDLRARRVVRSIPLGPHSEPVALKLAPNRYLLAVADAGGRQIEMVDLTGRGAAGRVALPAPPAALEMLRDGTQLFAALPDAGQVAAIDLKQMRLIVRLPVGQRPQHLIMKPDGGEMIASDAGSNSITIVSPYTDEIALTIPVGAAPVEALVTADSSRAYVANSGSDTISLVDIDNRRVLAGVRVGSGPFRMALTAGEQYLLVLHARSHDMAVLRVQANALSLLTLLPVGLGPTDLAVKSLSRISRKERRQ